MKTIKIYIRDEKGEEERETLGLPKLKGTDTLVDLVFNEKTLLGYWIDPDENDSTGAFADICFYLNGEGFRTPFNEKTLLMFDEILKS
jgi:hypothetical protein